jgi:hypothetical protein
MMRILIATLFLLGATLANPAQAVAPACTTISITNGTPSNALPPATAGASYSQTFTAIGSAATPFGYQITSGLPAGLGLSIVPSTGVLSGTPTQAGTFFLTITGRDTNGCTGGRTYQLDVGVGDQTINFTSTAPAAATVGGPTYNVTATATSGLPVALTIDATAAGVCSIAGSTVSFTAVGTCVIDANQAGNASFNAAPQVQQSFAVGMGSQAITFTSTPPASPTVGGPAYVVTATGGGSGNPVTFTIDATATSVCSITGASVSFLTTGTCVIDADQAGNANYNAAPQAMQSFAVGKSNQTITFTSTAPASATVGGATYVPTATATSGLTVAFTIDASAAAICSISAGTVSFTAAGTCVIDANQAGDSNYNPAPQVQQSFAVGKGDQTISFTSIAPASATVGGSTYNVTATATSGLPVTFTIDAAAASICSIAGSTVSFTAVGSCVIDANQAGNANYNAAPQVQQSFAVGQGSQTISFTSTAPVSAAVGGPTYNVTATATSGLTVTFTIDASASTVCSIAGSTVSFIGSGTCVIDANQAGDANYTAAPQVQQSFGVGLGNQTISFTSTAPAGAKVGGPTYNVTATGGASGNPVVFSIDATATSICSIAGSTVSFIAVGICVVDADQAGNANYNAALTAQQSFGVAKGDQTIAFSSSAPAATVGGPTYNVTATATSGLTVTFTIDATATSVCSINNITNTVSFTAVGTCIIDADQAGDTNWNPAPQAQQSFTVGQGSQTISFTSTAPATAKVGGATYNVTATATSGLPVTFTIDATATSICSIAGNVVSFTAVGTCKIDADQAGNANYTAAPQAQQTFSVGKGDQTINFTSTAPANALVGGATYNVTASATSALTVAFTIDASATSVCSIAGSTVSFLAGGTCVIDANQAGNANYNAAPQVQQSFTVSQPPNITSGNTTTFAPGKVGQTFSVTTTGFPTNASMAITTPGPLPTGVALVNNNNGTATLGGTPAALTQAGSPYLFTITANNGVAPNATQNFTLNIVCPAITVSGAAALSAVDATAMTPSTYSQVGGNGTINWSAAPLPTGVSINSGGTISGTPTATGTFSTTVTATDAGGCTGTKAVTFTSAPSAVGDSYSGMIDNTQAVVTGGSTGSPATPFISLSGSLLNNDAPAGSVTATAGSTATSAGGSVTIAADGTFIYTPAAKSGLPATTSDSFTYTVTSDSGGTGTPATSAPATVTLSLSNRIWYVKNNGGGSTGQSQSPFTTLSAAGGASTPNDILFVYNGDGTNSGMNAGLQLKNGQQLLGEANGLSVGSLTIAVGSRPTIGNSGGDGVTVAAGAGSLTGIFIKGLSVAGTANALSLSSGGASTLTATIDNVVVNNASANNGIKIAAASSGTSTVTVQNSSVSAATQNGIDARTAAGAGTLLLNINNNNVTATGNGILIDGSVAGTTTITGFANNSVGGNTGATGISVNSAIFDATPGVPFNTVFGGTTAIGVPGNGVGTNGMVLTNVSGDLSFTDLDIFNSAGAGLQASGTTPYTGSAGFQIAVNAGVATITAVGGPAVNLSNVKANNLPFNTISSANSPTTGVALNSLLGTFSAGSGSSIANSTGTGFQVGSSNATISYAGTINTTTGKGVDLTTNTGSTISFTGALTISSGTNTAFNATGGGTVTATDATSTLTSTTGRALNVVNTTIGGSGLKFKSIAANGAPNGITLTSTGAGGLTVVGDGGGSNNGSGGTIQATTGDGILMTDVSNISLGYMNITNPGLTGVKVIPVGWTLSPANSSTTNGVTNFTLNRCNLSDNAGAVASDDGLTVSNGGGNISITNDVITTARHQGITIDNFSRNMASLTLTGSSVTGTPGGDGILMQMRGTSVFTTGTISNNTISSNSATGLQVSNSDTGNIQGLTVQSNTVSGNNAGMDFDLGQSSNMTFVAQSNTFTNQKFQSINLFSDTGSTTGTMTATLRTNTIGTAGVIDSGSTSNGNGIYIHLNGGKSGSITVDGNIINEVSNASPLSIEYQAYAAGSTMKVKVINNQLKKPTGTANGFCGPASQVCPSSTFAMFVDDNGGAKATICMAVSGNSVFDPTSGPNGAGLAAFQLGVRTAGNALNIEGTQANARNQIITTNTITNPGPAPTTSDVFVDSGTPAIVPVGTCGAFPP